LLKSRDKCCATLHSVTSWDKYKVRPCVLVAALCAVCTSLTGADTDSPEGVVQAFESAYLRGDVDAAISAWDFYAAGKLYSESEFPPGVMINFESHLAEVFERELRDKIQNRVVARFGVSQCSFTKKEQISTAMVQLTESCRWADDFESSQDLIVAHEESGWRLVLYPNTRVYDPLCFTNAQFGIVVCSERDGSQVTAVQNGRELWRKDSHSDWGITPYRTWYPVVCSMTTAPAVYLINPPIPQIRKEHAVLITYDSSEFGVVDDETGTFVGLGQN
jgi:hypothetical protein